MPRVRGIVVFARRHDRIRPKLPPNSDGPIPVHDEVLPELAGCLKAGNRPRRQLSQAAGRVRISFQVGRRMDFGSDPPFGERADIEQVAGAQYNGAIAGAARAISDIATRDLHW